MKECVFIALLFLGVFGLIAFLFCYSGTKGTGVNSTVSGDMRIVEIETNGEKHEYLYYHETYGKSVCHLPNCKYCDLNYAPLKMTAFASQAVYIKKD